MKRDPLKRPPPNPIHSRQSGFSLIETMVAASVLAVGVMGLMWVFAFGVVTNKLGGEVASRTTLYGQAKIDQLMGLEYSAAGLTPGGGLDQASPVTGYVDYLDENGASTASSTASYQRQWKIAVNGSGNSKKISVAVWGVSAFSDSVEMPSTVLVSLKGNY